MPDTNGQPLPPIEEETLAYGEKYQTELTKVSCPHTNITRVSSLEARCSCGAGWQGPNIAALVNAIKSRV